MKCRIGRRAVDGGRRSTRILLLGCVLLIGIGAGAVAPVSAESPESAKASPPVPQFAKTLEPFFSRYCVDCHRGESFEGGFDIDDLSPLLTDPATFARFERIFDRVSDGEMPPPDHGAVSPMHLTSFRRVLGRSLHAAHAATRGTVLRRLNRREYQNTMNDLFGTNLNLAGTLPADGRAGEFDNVGAALSLSSVQLKQYIEAADRVMQASIAQVAARPEPIVIDTHYAETREGKKHIGTAWKLADDGAVVFFRPAGYPTGMLRTASSSASGFYKIRVTGSAYQSDRPITMAVGATTFQRGRAHPTFAYRELPPGKPTTVEVDAYIDERYMIEITPWGIADPDRLIKKHGVNAYPGPGLAINRVELIGPIVAEFPSRGHRLLFDGLDRRELIPDPPSKRDQPWYVPKFEIRLGLPEPGRRPTSGTQSSAERSLENALRRIATAAFRRPVERAEVEPYLDLFWDQYTGGSASTKNAGSPPVGAGESVEQAFRTAVAAIFCSPDFLFLSPRRGRLDDHALASRLSYFLARTSPDAELRRLAAERRLTPRPNGDGDGGELDGGELDGGELARQTERLLNGEHFGRFVADFTDAWLNLREIDFTAPDRKLYPEYDAFLQFSAVEQTRRFFRELVQANLPVRTLVKADFAFLNNRLAMHYGIPDVNGPAIRRVSLAPESRRGGLLSQASVLKVSANGTTTSPVVRGVYVQQRLLGNRPPPPPPGISGVEPDIRGATTIRELLEKHRDAENCRSCHAKIDPPGFALESFDPIGGWRDSFRSLGEGKRVQRVVGERKVQYRLGRRVDATGVMPDGRRFDGYQDFCGLLAKHPRRLATSLVEKLLTFACGREMGFSDRPTVARIVDATADDGYRVGDLIRRVVTSEAFLTK